MSYRIDVAGDAQADWRQLDVGVQEAVLDELDRLAEDPDVAGKVSRAHYDFDFERGGVKHDVFLFASVSPATQTLSVLGIGHFARPL